MADAKTKAKAAAGPGEDEAKETEAQPAEPEKKKFPLKKLLLFVGLPVLLLVGGGAGAHFAGLTKSLFGKHEAEDAHAEAKKPEPPKAVVFYNLPEMLVNLNSAGRRSNFLKISLSLELDSQADVPRLESVMPRIVDSFQSYLRELRVEDLRGSAGLHRLREELLQRVATAAQPAKVNDVLFKEMLVQ